MQELTLTGAHVRTLGVRALDGHAYGIAANSDVIAVSCIQSYSRRVTLFDLAGGQLLRSFGQEGRASGSLSGNDGIRFTPDGSHILVAESHNQRLSMFTLAGAFVCWIGDGVLKSPVDVDFASNGDILVADSYIHRIFVFSPDGDTLLRTFGSSRDTSQLGRLKRPTALAAHGGQLYVLDSSSSHVHVFD